MLNLQSRAAFFRLGQTLLAVDGDVLRQVLTVPKLSSVPRSQASLLGLFAERGNILPLFDLHFLLGLSATASRSLDLALLVEYQGSSFALSIDEMLGFFPYEPLKDLPMSVQQRFSKSMIQSGNQQASLLDIASIAHQLMTSVAA